MSLDDVIFQQSASRPSTGNQDLDGELNRALKTAAGILSVNPAFGFFDPDKFREPHVHGMNAFAYDADVGILGTSGLVGFGTTLFRNELFGYDESGTTVMAIVAHEFGHILQYQTGYYRQLSVFQCEINADFMAGYYLGVRKHRVASLTFKRAEDLFVRIGRAGEGNPNRSHGNSAERVTAARAGYRVGYDQRPPLMDAFQQGLTYVASLRPPR